MICDEIFSWATRWGTPKYSPKTYSAGQKTLRFIQNRASNYDLRQTLVMGIIVSRHTEIVPKDVLTWPKNPGTVKTKYKLRKNVFSGSKSPQVHSKTSCILWFAIKLSSGHQRVEAHRNSPRNDLRGSNNPQVHSNRATNHDFRQNLLLGTSVSTHTEIVAKNVLGRSKASRFIQNQAKKLCFATKSSPGNGRIEARRNSPEKRTQRVEIPPGAFKTELQTMIWDKIISWDQRVEAHRNSPQKHTDLAEKPRYSQNEIQTMNCDKIVCLASACQGTMK